MVRHRNCISTTNSDMKKVMANTGTNRCSMNVYNRFILNISRYFVKRCKDTQFSRIGVNKPATIHSNRLHEAISQDYFSNF